MRPTPIVFSARHGEHTRYLSTDETARLETAGAICWCYPCSDDSRPARQVYHLDDAGELCQRCGYPRVQGHCCPRCDLDALVAQEPRP